jgi:D-aminoacyl-tRNA deacylase
MAKKAIVLSKSDPAGETMLGAFRGMGFTETDDPRLLKMGEVYLLVLEPLIVPAEEYRTPSSPSPYPADFDSMAKRLSIDYFVMASRHWSQSGQPCLTVHPTGNFGKAVYGGRPRELQRTLANPMRDVFMELAAEPPHGFQVSLEATHHSPTQFETPMFFAEVGSGERQWRDEAVCRYLAEAILAGVKADGEAPVSIGFGGGHYCPTFSVMENERAFGHVAAKYALDMLTEELVSQMVERTLDGVESAVLDGGLKGWERKKVEVTLKKLDISY